MQVWYCAAILKTELYIINILLISSNNGQIFNNGEKRAALKIHAGADEKHDITKLRPYLPCRKKIFTNVQKLSKPYYSPIS